MDNAAMQYFIEAHHLERDTNIAVTKENAAGLLEYILDNCFGTDVNLFSTVFTSGQLSRLINDRMTPQLKEQMAYQQVRIKHVISSR